MLLVYLFACFVVAQSAPSIPFELDTVNENNRVSGIGVRFLKCITDQLVHVPYKIEDKFSEDFRGRILKSLTHYESQTCLRFTNVENLTDPFFGENSNEIIYFTSCTKDRPYVLEYLKEGENTIIDTPLNEHGFSGIGRINQQLYYALGFTPENLREDRDNYVTVLWDHIEPDQGYEKMFSKLPYEEVLKFPYDLRSISHYFPDDFSSEIGLSTLVSKNPETPLKKNTKLSPLDVYKINLRYCQEPETSTTDESPETTDPFVSTTEIETETETETTTDSYYV